jgi:hypothetical protein
MNLKTASYAASKTVIKKFVIFLIGCTVSANLNGAKVGVACTLFASVLDMIETFFLWRIDSLDNRGR